MPDAVVVDTRERESLLHALQALGVPTVRQRLAVGDYVAGAAIVERKTVSDLHASIIERRFWRQIGRLSRSAEGHPYLLVEGTDLDAGPLRPESVRGAVVAVGEPGVNVIRSDCIADSARWLAVLLARNRPWRRSRRVFAPRACSPAEAMLAAVPGISTVSARALLRDFGSIAGLLEAGPNQWLSTPGVDPKRAQALLETLVGANVRSSRARSARPGPST